MPIERLFSFCINKQKTALVLAVLACVLTACDTRTAVRNPELPPADPVTEGDETKDQETPQEQEAALPPLTDEYAARFLTQATFAPTTEDWEHLLAIGYEEWLDEQMAMSAAVFDINKATDRTDYLPERPVSHLMRTRQLTEAWVAGVDGNSDADLLQDSPYFNRSGNYDLSRMQLAAWWDIILRAPDQLRQRMAFALSELLVTSTGEPPLQRRGESIASYYDILVRHAFGNYRDLLYDVTRSVTMGIYLSHQGNSKGDPATGRTPDENYAREVMQLFSIGLYELHPDGTPKKDFQGNLIPTYTQQDIQELARVFTGWTRKTGATGSGYAKKFGSVGNTGIGYDEFMECDPAHHDDGEKLVLGKSIAAGGDCTSDAHAALDILFQHPNAGPYVVRHLIQRLVTSNPSPEYLERVVAVFDDNGNGVRGDLSAVLRQILLDEAAWDTRYVEANFHGRIKSPIEITAQLVRTFKYRYVFENLGYATSPIIEPMRSQSVFNFYSPDYRPLHEDFSNTENVVPESELFSETGITEIVNYIHDLIHKNEARLIAYENGGAIETWLQSRDITNRKHRSWLIDFEPQLNVMLDAIGAGDFTGLNTDQALREKAISALLDHLNLLMTANRLPDDFISALYAYLRDERGVKASAHDPDLLRAIVIVQEAVRSIASSSYFIVQK